MTDTANNDRMSAPPQKPMSMTAAKRLLATATGRIVRSNKPGMDDVGMVFAAIGSILSYMVGTSIRLRISAEGLPGDIDMTSPDPTTPPDEPGTTTTTH